MERFLLQMHGESGAGKSTLALAVGRATGAVVIDKDRIKGPLIDGGLEDMHAGALTYDVLWLQVQSFLAQGFSVVLDSPAFWAGIVDRGRSLASKTGAGYYIVECRCEDVEEQERRLVSRPRFASQPGNRAALAIALARPGVIRELEAPHLTVDTTRPIEVCVNDVLEYLRS